MSLTPLDVRKQQFRRAVRGVDADEVKVFLGLVAEEMEKLLRTNAALTERVSVLDEKIEEYQSLERALRDAVVAVQDMRDESRRHAEKETELLIQRAEDEAERIVRDAEARVDDLRRELDELEGDRRGYLIRLRSLIETHLKMIEAGELRQEALDTARAGGEPRPSRRRRPAEPPPAESASLEPTIADRSR